MGAVKAGCERAREWISLEVDEELPELDRARLRAHLARCAACAEVADRVRVVATMLADAPLEEPTATVAVPPRRIGIVRLGLAAAVIAIVAGGFAGVSRMGTEDHDTGPAGGDVTVVVDPPGPVAAVVKR